MTSLYDYFLMNKKTDIVWAHGTIIFHKKKTKKNIAVITINLLLAQIKFISISISRKFFLQRIWIFISISITQHFTY